MPILICGLNKVFNGNICIANFNFGIVAPTYKIVHYLEDKQYVLVFKVP